MDIFVVIHPNKEIKAHQSAQDAADDAGIHRHTLRKAMKKEKRYEKRGYLIIKIKLNRIYGRGRQNI